MNKPIPTFLDRRSLGFPLLQDGTALVLDRLPLLALLLVLLALALLYVTSRAARGRGVVRDTTNGDESGSGAKQDSMLVLGDEVLDAVDDALRRRGGGHGGMADGCSRRGTRDASNFGRLPKPVVTPSLGSMTYNPLTMPLVLSHSIFAFWYV